VGAIVTSLLYITIGLVLAGIVGQALSRSGRAFLRTKFDGQDTVADAVDRLLVVAFYLLAAGFIALTVPAGAHVIDGGQALRLLSVKLGELLLVLGALHLASTLTFARLRGSRASSRLAGPDHPDVPGGPGAGADGPDVSGSDISGSDISGSAGGGSGPAGLRGATPVLHASAAHAATARTAAARTAAADGGRLGSTRLWRPSPRDVVH